MFLRQRKPSHIGRCSCSQWKLAQTRNVTSGGGGGKFDLWSGKFSKGLLQSKGTPTASPANDSCCVLSIPFSVSLSPLCSRARYISTTGLSKLHTRTCLQLQSPWASHQHSHDSEALQHGCKVCQLKEILCHRSYTRLWTLQVNLAAAFSRQHSCVHTRNFAGWAPLSRWDFFIYLFIFFPNTG